MSNGAEEIEDISKRLAEIERAIGELRAGELAIMKTIAAELCEMYYTIFTLFYEGEEVKKYTELWTKKLAETKQTILGLETSEAVIGTRDKFVKDLADYAKAAIDSAAKTVEKVEKVQKVDYVEEAMAIANAFMKKDNPVALPLKAVIRDDIWLVDVDIGAVRMEIVRVKIDANTGNILGHETVEKK
jgi:hypothetical protein